MSFSTPHLASLLLLATAAAFLAACDDSTTAAAPKPPTIVQFESAYFNEATDTLHAGERLDFYGSVTDKSGLSSWSLTTLDTTGRVLDSAAMPAISGTSISFDLATKSANTLSVTNPGNWGYTGTFLARLSVTNSSGLTATKELRFVASLSSTTTD